MAKHPMQPIVIGEDGVARFQENPIVKFLLEVEPFNLNAIAALPGVSDDDRAQFAQLIGYTVDGYADLSYVTEESANWADEEAERLRQ